MIIKCSNYILEKLGVNEDGEILSDFLINFLMTAEPDNLYVFINPDVLVIENIENDFLELVNDASKEKDKSKRDEIGTKIMDLIRKNPSLLKYLKSFSKNKKTPKKETEPIIINEMPKLSKKIYKIYVNYSTKDMDGTLAFFDPMNSKYTKDGYIMHFTFLYKENMDKIWKHHIYHEVHHGIQYLKKGKKEMIFIRKNIRNHIMKNLMKDPFVSEFLQLLYHTISVEQGAFIPQFYGKLKYRKKIKSIKDLDEYFRKRDIYEYRTVRTLINVDVEKLFNSKIKNILTDEIIEISKDQKIIFFSLLKKVGRELKEIKDLEELNSYLLKKGIELKDEDMISDTELESTMRKYTKYFNKVGRNMMKKLDKTYPLLYDFYTKKFEAEKKTS